MSDAQNKGLSGATIVAGHTAGTPAPQAASTPPGTPAPVPVAHSGSMQAAVDLVGTVLSDRYRILKKLGEGGMGSVYLAEHTTINKKLAIKVLSPEYSHKQDLVDRFLQEARAASMIDQQNVVEITDFGSTPNGSVFFVMEFLPGEDLSDTIKNEGPIPWARAKPIVLQICAALEAAHDAGIIHRDMKPENCFRIRRGNNEDFIKVLDFGIAKVTSDEGEGGRALTRTGMIFGTPEYMSPEQAKGERVDHRVDVYAVGVIIYELLTGRVPFTADTFMGILTKHMFEAPPAPSTIVPTAQIPSEAEAIILKALQKDREYRFQSMKELAEAVEAVGTGLAAVDVVQENVAAPATGKTHFSTGAPAVEDTDDLAPPRSRAGLFVGGVVAAVLLVGGGLWAFSGPGAEDEPETESSVSEVVVASPDPVPEPDEKAESDDGTDSTVVPPAVPRTVAITISTPGVEGKVYDNRDDSLIGNTNEPIELPHSADTMDLYVRAEGYEDHLVDLVPDVDKTITAALTRLQPDKAGRSKRTRSKRRTRSKSKSSSTKSQPKKSTTDSKPKSEPKPKPTPDPKPKSGGSTSPDLKDPFGKK